MNATVLRRSGASQTTPVVSVITVGFRSDAELRVLAAHLDSPKNSGLEWLVVHNSMPVERIATTNISTVELVTHRNVGFAKAFNEGLHQASGRVIVSLNPDTRPTPELLKALRCELDASSSSSPLCVAPTLVTDGVRYVGRRFYSLGTLLMARSAMRGRLMAAHVGDVEWVLGACFAMKTSDLRRLGGLDSRYFLYFEDVDLCWRIWAAGGKVRALDLELEHTHRRSSTSVGTALMRHITSALRFFCAHPQAAWGHAPSRVAPGA